MLYAILRFNWDGRQSLEVWSPSWLISGLMGGVLPVMFPEFRNETDPATRWVVKTHIVIVRLSVYTCNSKRMLTSSWCHHGDATYGCLVSHVNTSVTQGEPTKHLTVWLWKLQELKQCENNLKYYSWDSSLCYYNPPPPPPQSSSIIRRW